MHEKGILPSTPLDEEWARLIRRVVFSCRQIHRVPRIHGEIVRHGMLIPIRKAMGSRRTETGIFQEREWLLFRETSNWIRIPLPFYLLSVEMHDEIDTGGMPEAVQAYVDNRLPSDIRAIQKTIIADYALDISKHAPKEILGRASIRSGIQSRNNSSSKTGNSYMETSRKEHGQKTSSLPYNGLLTQG